MYGYDLFIAPDHRGHGTPDEFLAAVEAELVRLGYHRMFGFVDSANRPARWLYATTATRTCCAAGRARSCAACGGSRAAAGWWPARGRDVPAATLTDDLYAHAAARGSQPALSTATSA